MLSAPTELQQRMPFKYPSDNHEEFEWWYFDSPKEWYHSNRVYLPVLWTAYYVRNNIDKRTVADMKYGEHCHTSFHKLQNWLNRLPSDTKYYTIVQHDDGILHDLSHLDITVFSMGGGKYDHALPLISQPHEWQFPNTKRTLKFSFVGQITHPIRQKIVDKYGYKSNDVLIITHKMPLKEYCQILSMSEYVLCPRGYGPTSFRIQEAIQYGAVPIYISDTFVEPYRINFENYGYKVHLGEFDSFKLTDLPCARSVNGTYADMFTYEVCKTYIESNI